ncbi:hypothetical protein Ciccas_013350 [Cichlidogyrus casuarinus]|uniref:EF-hand domain-containing protein n=1 Tax=Cichlidogyrus casuarinus TaxID=1844966 RepID=A0ABD2PMM1_9PLAT
MSCNPNAEEVKAFLKSLDKDQNGKLSVQELLDALRIGQGACQHITKAHVESFIKQYDKDGDSCLSYEEAAKVLLE